VAVAVAVGAAAAVRTGGYTVPAEIGARLRALSAGQSVLVTHLARRICAPDDGRAPSADEVDVAGFVDDYVAEMAAPMRRDLLRFFGAIEHVLPLGLGSRRRFTDLAPADQDRVLASLEESSVDLLRGGFAGLKSLIFMGYYRDPRTWAILGYDGPRVGRPERGWGAP
jgi:hypothetical protein